MPGDVWNSVTPRARGLKDLTENLFLPINHKRKNQTTRRPCWRQAPLGKSAPSMKDTFFWPQGHYEYSWPYVVLCAHNCIHSIKAIPGLPSDLIIISSHMSMYWGRKSAWQATWKDANDNSMIPLCYISYNYMIFLRENHEGKNKPNAHKLLHHKPFYSVKQCFSANV